MSKKTIAITMIAGGMGLNFLDAYMSGNLPFSPDGATTMNSVTEINNLLFVPTGTLVAIAGVVLFIWG